MFILAIIFVPIGFLVLYPILRLITRGLYRRHANFRSLTGAWLPGAFVAAALVVAGNLIGTVQRMLGK